MKFKSSIVIKKPQAIVAELFADPDNLGEYQDGFVRKELISGQAGKKGAISKMYYKVGNNDMELTETVIADKLPDHFEAFYHHKHMDNTMKCRFVPIDEENTRYESEFDYVRISWIVPKLMFFLFPGMFRKQGEKWMRQFKEFAEKQ